MKYNVIHKCPGCGKEVEVKGSFMQAIEGKWPNEYRNIYWHKECWRNAVAEGEINFDERRCGVE